VWPEQDYLTGESYDDKDFVRLLGRACEGTGLAAKDMLRRFGVFAGSRSFAALYPDYYAKSGNTRRSCSRSRSAFTSWFAAPSPTRVRRICRCDRLARRAL